MTRCTNIRSITVAPGRDYATRQSESAKEGRRPLCRRPDALAEATTAFAGAVEIRVHNRRRIVPTYRVPAAGRAIPRMVGRTRRCANHVLVAAEALRVP
jgi:hypothetical protein